MNTRNILLIGRTGSGKTALANVLFNKEENFEERGMFEEIFNEGEYSTSETKNIQSKEVEINEVKYRIIDTIGIGDTKLTDEEIAFKLFEVCYELREGLSQVLFTIGGRITQEEIKIYNVMRKKIFDENVANFTTIVRTKFNNFLDKKKCKEDIERMKIENKRNNKRIVEMVNLCKEVIHINNLPMSSSNEREMTFRKKRRKESRDIIVEHLETCCQDIYRPGNLELINEIFTENFVNWNKNEFMEFLKGEIKELKKENFLSKKFKQLLKKKIETVKEMQRSSLQATIEIGDNCKQM